MVGVMREVDQGRMHFMQVHIMCIREVYVA